MVNCVFIATSALLLAVDCHLINWLYHLNFKLFLESFCQSCKCHVVILKLHVYYYQGFFKHFSVDHLIVSVWSHRWYFAVISMSGVFAVTFSVIFAYVADITQEHERSTAYGLVSRGPWFMTSVWCCAVTWLHSICATAIAFFVAMWRILVSCCFNSRLRFPFCPANKKWIC